MKKFKCKICRRLGQSVCSRAKCAILRKSSPPGKEPNARTKKISEYGIQLREKQKLRYSYNLSEKQFSKYVKGVLIGKRKIEVSAADQLIGELESRLDNTVYRIGFASTRLDARQIVSHGHIMVNGKKVDIPSYKVKAGDEVQLKPASVEKNKFQLLRESLEGFIPSKWLSLDLKNMKGKVLRLPSSEEANIAIETSFIFEFYSK